VHNLAFHDLTPKGTIVPSGLKSLLGLSLKFIPTPTYSLHPNVYKTSLQQLFRQIRIGVMLKQNTDAYYNKLIYIPKPEYNPPKTYQHIEQFINHTWKKAQSANFSPRITTHYNLNHRHRTLLRKMRGQKELKILQTDKNLGPAIMTCGQYHNFCMDHLTKQINEIPLAAIQKKNNRLSYRTLSNRSISNC